jgi:hypothetical protein
MRGGRVLARGTCRQPRRENVSPCGFTRLAEALASRGQHRAAIAAVRDGIEAQEETAALRWGAELQRLQGIGLIGLNRLLEGQIALEEALRVARQQQTKAYELRAATSLARLWGRTGKAARSPRRYTHGSPRASTPLI